MTLCAYARTCSKLHCCLCNALVTATWLDKGVYTQPPVIDWLSPNAGVARGGGTAGAHGPRRLPSERGERRVVGCTTGQCPRWKHNAGLVAHALHNCCYAETGPFCVPNPSRRCPAWRAPPSTTASCGWATCPATTSACWTLQTLASQPWRGQQAQQSQVAQQANKAGGTQALPGM